MVSLNRESRQHNVPTFFHSLTVLSLLETLYQDRLLLGKRYSMSALSSCIQDYDDKLFVKGDNFQINVTNYLTDDTMLTGTTIVSGSFLYTPLLLY